MFTAIEPPPLTPERIAAIRSDPNSAKSVQVILGCKKCTSNWTIYAALDRSKEREDEGWLWYETIPDTFICECGTTTLGLGFLRRNLLECLGRERRDIAELNFVPLYESSSIASLRRTFADLLNSHPQEELLHKFIDENPILLHQFPADKIFLKPRILTSFVADFCILTSQQELILIELERTTTRLMKKDGGLAAPLSHAFDQVRDWLHLVREHRLSVLDSLNIDKNEVGSVRGVVIAGRHSGYNEMHLLRLKSAYRGEVTLLTYDDLLLSLDALIRRMDAL